MDIICSCSPNMAINTVHLLAWFMGCDNKVSYSSKNTVHIGTVRTDLLSLSEYTMHTDHIGI